MSRIVRFHETGGPEVLKIDDVPDQEPGSGEVRIRVEALGLNRAECMLRQGKYAFAPVFPSRIGLEAAGVVEVIGPGVTNVAVGDRVSTVPYLIADEHGNWTDKTAQYGVYGETATVAAAAVVHYPDNLTPEQGTAIWCQYLTAWGGMFEFAKLTSSDVALVTAAGSSAGLAGVQLAKGAGALTIATTRGSDKKEALLQYADHVVVTDEQDLAQIVKEVSGGRGASVVYDPIGGPFLSNILEAAAPEARIVEYGNLSPDDAQFAALFPLLKRLNVKWHSLFDTARRPEELASGVRYVFDRLKSGALVPVIDKVFPSLDNIADAHRYMESNQQIGKIVVKV